MKAFFKRKYRKTNSAVHDQNEYNAYTMIDTPKIDTGT